MLPLRVFRTGPLKLTSAALYSKSRLAHYLGLALLRNHWDLCCTLFREMKTVSCCIDRFRETALVYVFNIECFPLTYAGADCLLPKFWVDIAYPNVEVGVRWLTKNV